ncbi:unnamed protein product [Orchesella dallaii]|uniref:Uncharacterized protein n=1 Tax=Orchesella dallaii TaxID=48710 RepID=A0ABP1PT47_9HEXA
MRSGHNYKIFNGIDDELYGAEAEKSKVCHDNEKRNEPISCPSDSPSSPSSSEDETKKVLRASAPETSLDSSEEMNTANFIRSPLHQSVHSPEYYYW